MGKNKVRTILGITMIDTGRVYKVGDVSHVRHVESVKFMRDGLAGVNTAAGLRDQSCYIVRLVHPENDKDIKLKLIPYARVEEVEYAEETPEEKDTCEVPSVELEKMD